MGSLFPGLLREGEVKVRTMSWGGLGWIADGMEREGRLL